ncbi:ornithine cyclodeaminase [Clostridium aestuarii]|uniref:Ornithine cyclodeaminase n=1 Tax=Clostridium aestuarii TaxID=338193 RepID=A0ABT4D270_9CLOT|nr:ornithine cyclodeaminase [Clostridium aestuarii]MCY6484385.1 ornithine cyclodeaminase [Clostridium aestuarii]
MKIFTHYDIIDLNIEPIQCYKWVSNMLEDKGNVILPSKISMRPTEGIFYNVMPSLLPQYNGGGIKVVTRYPSRKPALDSQIMIYDYKTGNIKALMDGNYITTMRTGAVAAHSIKLLGKKNFNKIGIIGLGNQARATLKVLLSLFPYRKILLKLMKYKDQHLLFQEYIKNLSNSDNIEFVLCDSYEDVVKGSDIIISSVTYFAQDICEDNCFDEGCLVVPIHTRGFMNCDLFFDKVYADDTDHVKGFKYFNQFKKFAEISDVLSGDAEGRMNDEERIIIYNIGLSMHDVYFAEKIYQIAQLKEVGQEISLDSPKDKFWI